MRCCLVMTVYGHRYTLNRSHTIGVVTGLEMRGGIGKGFSLYEVLDSALRR